MAVERPDYINTNYLHADEVDDYLSNAHLEAASLLFGCLEVGVG